MPLRMPVWPLLTLTLFWLDEVRGGKDWWDTPILLRVFILLVSAWELVKFQFTKMKNQAAAWSDSLGLVRRPPDWQVSAATVRTHCNDCNYFTIVAIVHWKFVSIAKETRLPSHTLTIVAIFYENCDGCEIPWHLFFQDINFFVSNKKSWCAMIVVEWEINWLFLSALASNSLSNLQYSKLP